MKKLVCMILIMGLLGSLFVGCTSEDSQTDSTPTTDNTKETKKGSEKSETTGNEAVVIDWLAYQTSAQPDEEAEIVKMVEERYNVDFNFWFIDDQKWNEALNVRLASGDMPDVMRIRDDNLFNYVEQGVVVELPIEKLEEKAPDFVAAVNAYDPNGYLWNKSKLSDGKNYGWSMVQLDAKYHTILEWRQDWLSNVGITKVPETLEEFEAAMYAFRNDDPNQSGQQDTYGMSIKAMNAVFGAFGSPTNIENGSEVMIKDGEIVFTATQPEMKEALALLNKWYNDGIIDPEFITGENTGGYWALSHAFMNDRVGVTGGINYYHYAPPGKIEGPKGGPCYRETKAINPNAEVTLGSPIEGPYGQGVLKGGMAGELFGITAKATESEAKVDVILTMLNDIFNDEEYSMMVSHGIQGTHFELDESGEVNYLYDRDPVQMREQGIQIFDFLTGSPDVRSKIMSSRYEYAEKYATAPYYERPTMPSVDALNENKETLKRITEEAYIQIITGEKSVDYFDEFETLFNENGGDESLKALNETYNSLK
ncbi:type 2 periplasmic-binding domain-containing protein [Vallitalea okinawensis]|uniref:extracellular solute-binding protein n=1 Tax=Vallitalea okinawensis TaxID=2078660 RepID=UPI000CFD271D|nr:extracellular solute-binding protein [Vallitalea okinawensis]